jgi:xylan 1,4-beta-xylosidase
MKTLQTRSIAGLVALTCVCLLHMAVAVEPATRPPTFCNPLDLPYRFGLKPPAVRTAADPTVVVYHHEYWLFPSKSGGYWHSPDLLHWSFVVCKSLPVEGWAPTAEVLNGKLIWTTTGAGAIFATDDPLDGDKWVQVAEETTPQDPDLFVSKDGHLYFYSGCSASAPILGGELDSKTLLPLAPPAPMIAADPQNHGWEATKSSDFFEGPWMNEHEGTFYLQYAAPGTERREYGDGVYTSKSPLGPWTFAPYSPFSYKPTGFVTGTGHSSTFQDLSGEYWHVTTATISVREPFERRLALFPAGFTLDGQLYCNTYLGDYPQYAPTVPGDHVTGRSPGWMLLSYKKPAQASSTLAKHPVADAFDENIRTWWSAATGHKGEWLQVDLGKICRLEAIQINFADQDAQATGFLQNDGYSYTIETSANGTAWTPCVDKSPAPLDTPHAYVQLPAPVKARYLRITNVHSPADSKFSISGFRVFGNGLGAPPPAVEGITATRAADARLGTVSWNAVEGADFYIVRYGVAAAKLFTNYQVYDGTTLSLNALNRGVSYVVTVDAVNDSGVTPGRQVVSLP